MTDVRGRWRNRLVATGLLGLSVLSALVILEIVWRFVVFGPDALSVARMNSVHAIGEAGLLQAAVATGVG